MKIDPPALDAWANALRRSPGALLWLLRHDGAEAAEAHVARELRARGVPPSRVWFTDRAAWVEHVAVKTAADVVLDTVIKNGERASKAAHAAPQGGGGGGAY